MVRAVVRKPLREIPFSICATNNSFEGHMLDQGKKGSWIFRQQKWKLRQSDFQTKKMEKYRRKKLQ